MIANMLFLTFLPAGVYFFIPGVFGNLEAAFRVQQFQDTVCNANSLTDLGIVRNVIACGRICSNMAGCRGFHFNEAESRCWGSNQTKCQALQGSVYYHKESQTQQQLNATTNPDCGPAPAITNAIVSAGGTLEGETRNYTCSPGYVLRNVVTVDTTCQSDGTWSTPSFDCLWECDAPPAIANAVVSGGDTIEGTVRFYTCNAGYAANGTTAITCQAGTTWSGVAVACVVDCGPPPAITNAIVSAGATLEGETHNYTCSPGYVLRNIVIVDTTCQSDGTWSTSSFDCLWECDAPPIIANAVVSGGDTIEGTVRVYRCNAGYAANGTTTITCQAGTTWSAVAFACFADCSPPPAITNAIVSAGGTLEGETRNYTCSPDYVLRNVVTVDITCQSDGTWSTPSFDCLWDCDVPPVIANAVVSGGDTIEGTVRVYSCNTGYVVNGTTTITCQAGTTWSAVAFACVVESQTQQQLNATTNPDCGPPPAITNAIVSAGGTLEGETRNYSCLLGYVLRNVVTVNITCQSDGNWSTPSFDCMWDCGFPPVEVNASVLPGDTTEGTIRSYTCNTGYASGTGTMSIMCQSSGAWTSATFTCLRDCGPPLAFSNADISAGGTLEGETRSYSCPSSYVLRNLVTVETTCQSDGTWSVASFDCLWDCNAPPVVVNAVVSGGDTIEGTVRGYTCNVGYAANGTATITCQAGNTWSAVAFACVVDCGEPPAITNAQVSAGGTSPTDTRTYTCSTGHVFRNLVNAVITCQSDSTWSTASFDCLWDCGTPPSMPNGIVSAGDTVQGLTRSYTCDYGYDTTGTATITCVDGTGWSAPTSICTELVCDSGWHKIELSCYFTPGDGTGFESDVFTARDLCHTYDAYLIQLETESESNVVEPWFFGLYPGISVWIGLTDEAVEGTWVWMNSSVKTTWTDWADIEPNGGTSGNYCRLRGDATWGDLSGPNGLRQPLCEKSAALP